MMSYFKLIFILIASGLSAKTFAQEPRVIKLSAKWDSERGSPSLSIDVADTLTSAQKEIVNSGFSTFTLLAISEEKMLPRDALPDQRVVCSVKYDTWEEMYQAIRVEPLPIETLSIKEYKDWATKCLHISITAPEILRKLADGGNLNGVLQIRQSSPDESAKIKKWLVQQQSGFMQGLYAHMLGDFQYQGVVKLEINVPRKQSANHHIPETRDAPRKRDNAK